MARRRRRKHTSKRNRREKSGVVPPTPYYYGKRAELFLFDAEQALEQGEHERHAQLIERATHYQGLAGQLPLER